MAQRSYFNTIAQRAQPGASVITPPRRLARAREGAEAADIRPVAPLVSRRTDAGNVALGREPLVPSPPGNSDAPAPQGAIALVAPQPRQTLLAQEETSSSDTVSPEPAIVRLERLTSASMGTPPLQAAPAKPDERGAPARDEPKRSPVKPTALETALGAAMQWVGAQPASAATTEPARGSSTAIGATASAPPATRAPRPESVPAPTRAATPVPARAATPAPNSQAMKITPQPRSIHIGTIDVQIVKPSTPAPQPSSVSRVERVPATGVASGPSASLARGFTSPIGFRQS
jgi:hypothetical protein